MKSISELNNSILSPTGDEWLVVNQPTNEAGTTFKSVKMKVSMLRGYIRGQNESNFSFLITETSTDEQVNEKPILTQDGRKIICVL